MIASIFFLTCFSFVLHNSPLLHKISCTHAPCMESFCSKLYLTPSRCYRYSQMCLPFAAPQATGSTAAWGTAQGSEQWDNLWKPQPGSGPAIAKFDQRPRQIDLIKGSPFWGVSNWVWYPVEPVLPQETSCTHSWVWMALVCESEAATEILNSGMEK